MKKAFTLIELIIAISLFSIIIVYMYQAVSTTKKSVSSYERVYEQDKQALIAQNVLYNDIFNQTDPYKNTSIETKKPFSVYALRTNNSLHDIASPYVIYAVKDEVLYRYESAKPFKFPINDENIHHIKVDALLENVSLFMVYAYKNDKLIEWVRAKKRSVFEISLPYSREIVVVGD